MKFVDAAIAATVLARGDKLLVLDADFDRLKHRTRLIRPGSQAIAGTICRGNNVANGVILD